MKIFRLAFLVVLCACSSHTQQSQKPDMAPTSGTVKIVLTASPRQGFAPLHVTFHATLQGAGPNDGSFHCLKEEWDFGDGAVSSQTPNCVPLTPDGKIETEFVEDHTYDRLGNYGAWFTLGDKKVRSNKATVTVLENTANPANPGR